MKHIFIGTEAFKCFYQDHPDGNQIATVLGSQMEAIRAGTGDKCNVFKCGDTTAVFGFRDSFVFLLVSDSGECEQYLSHQVVFLQDVLESKYNTSIFKTISNRPRTRELTNLFNNIKNIFQNQQSFLIGATEHVDIGDHVHTIGATVKEDISKLKLKTVSNILLTCGTKVILNFGQKGFPPLLGYEIQIILPFLCAHFRSLGIDYVKRNVEAVRMNDKMVKRSFKYEEGHFDTIRNEEKKTEVDATCSQSESKEQIDPPLLQSYPEFPEGVEMKDIRKILKDLETPESKQKHEPLHDKLYLKSFCYGIHSYELQNSIRLTLLTTSKSDNNVLDNAAATIKSSLLPSLLFIDTKAMHHLESLKEAYIEQFPGLIHYILVDRTNDRLFAPQISSLEGRDYCHPTNYSIFQQVTKQQIQSTVWDLVAKSRTCLDNGYLSMLMTCGDYRYSYNLWYEELDSTGTKLPVKVPLKPLFTILKENHRLFSRSWYQDLEALLFPNKKVKCYEFFGLFLSGVDAVSISQCNENLPRDIRKYLHL